MYGTSSFLLAILVPAFLRSRLPFTLKVQHLGIHYHRPEAFARAQNNFTIELRRLAIESGQGLGLAEPNQTF